MNKVMALSLGLAALGIVGLAAPSFADTTAAVAPVTGVTTPAATPATGSVPEAKVADVAPAKVAKDHKHAKADKATKPEHAAKPGEAAEAGEAAETKTDETPSPTAKTTVQ